MRRGSLQRAFNAAIPRRHGSGYSKPTAAAIALWDAVLDTPRVLDGDLEELTRCVVEDETCINMQKANGCTALYIAAEIGSLDAVELLLKHGADPALTSANGEGPLFVASYGGHLPVVKALLGAKASVDAASGAGATPLFIASQNGHSTCCDALLEAGADVDAAKKSGATSCHIAAEGGHAECLRLLAAAGADLSKTIKANGQTALHVAAKRGHVACVKALVAHGASLDAQDSEGSTPLWLAMCREQKQCELALRAAEESRKKKQQGDGVGGEGVGGASGDGAGDDEHLAARRRSMSRNAALGRVGGGGGGGGGGGAVRSSGWAKAAAALPEISGRSTAGERATNARGTIGSRTDRLSDPNEREPGPGSAYCAQAAVSVEGRGSDSRLSDSLGALQTTTGPALAKVMSAEM